ncbi:MAG: hypothetical protein HW379_1566, partial [Actinobacteria bacterium]|nr:hypothetical protein [Actinomycetota bacterium]
MEGGARPNIETFDVRDANGTVVEEFDFGLFDLG